MVEVLWKGLVLGFSIAAPVGPIGVLCIQRTLARGPAAGVATGLGAATADAIFGLVAGLGLMAVIAPLTSGSWVFQALSAVLLVVMGLRIAGGPAAAAQSEAAPPSLWAQFASTLVLAVLNPIAIVLFVALFAGLDAGPLGWGELALMIASIFVGSLGWWLLLCGGVGLLRERVLRFGRLINLVSGLVIAGFGAALAWSLVSG